MADDGRSRDKKMLSYLQYHKLNLIVFSDDHPVEKKIKKLMNEYANIFAGAGHSIYLLNKIIHRRHKIEIKINQLRFKNWYFEPIRYLSEQEYRKKKILKLNGRT